MEYYKYPVKKIGITSDYGYRTDPYAGFHSGLDLGWMDYQGEEVYSIGSGEVINVGYTSVMGNYITIRHSNGDESRYLHLKDQSNLSVGNIVSMGSFLGIMGATGNATGVHLHVGITKNGESVDPKTVLYVYPDQYVSDNTKNNYNVLYYDVSEIKTTTEDVSKNQLKVNVFDLQIRKGPGTTYEKYSDYVVENGIYDYFEVIENETYTWYKIGDNAYIANEGTWLTIYEKQNNEELDKLNKKISLLEEDIKLKETIISSLQKQSIDLETYKFKYDVLETGKYKIRLNNDEILIIK